MPYEIGCLHLAFPGPIGYHNFACVPKDIGARSTLLFARRKDLGIHMESGIHTHAAIT